MGIALLGLAVAASATAVALGRQSHQVDEEHSVDGARRHRPRARHPARRLRDERQALPGHLLPARPAGGPDAYRNSAWLGDTLERAGPPAILVMPQGARAGDTDAEYLNWGAGRNWETFIAEELPAAIDKRFRTIRSRRGRALIGLSAGGFGATVLGLHHLGRFAVVESWSGYFHPTDPTGTRALARGPLTSAHNLISVLKADERHRPTFFGVLRRRRRLALPRGEPPAESRAERRARQASLRGLQRRPHDEALAGARARLARAGARASRSPPTRAELRPSASGYSIGISKRAMMPGSPPLASSSGSGSRVATHA